MIGRLLALSLVLGCGPLLAADAKPVPVYTDPAQTDADFPFQGEYRGWQSALGGQRSSESIGLQVIALGDGKFDAVKYYGGLPGAGWFGGQKFPMKGERTEGIVTLAGDQYDIVLDGQSAAVYTHAGRKVGELQKVCRVSPTLGAAPPPGAIVLYDGTGTTQFKNAKVTEDGLLMAGADTVGAWNDFRLHGEFRLPYKPLARGQARGNSGFYLQSRYELQVLDSFGLEGIENECGGLYRLVKPQINMCLPPLEWQTYDIDFTAPRFDEQGNKVSDMRISVWHNGILIHNNVALTSKTGAGKPEGPEPLPTKLQDHDNPVVYRNLWLVDKSAAPDLSNGPAMVPPRYVPPVPVSAPLQQAPAVPSVYEAGPVVPTVIVPVMFVRPFAGRCSP